MTAGRLRSAAFRPITAACPVVVQIDTPAGPVELVATGWRYERVYGTRRGMDGEPVLVLESDRLVLLARAGEGGAG